MGYLNNTGLSELWSRIKQLKLANPNKLTFTGASTGSYDGSSALTVNIPSGSGGVTIPAGTINIYAGASAPDGWLLCDGSSVSSSTYPDLYAAIGTTYGGTSSSFMLPNLCDNVAVGAGSTYTLGDTGGEAAHTLTEDEMPSHTHGQDDSSRYPLMAASAVGRRTIKAGTSTSYANNLYCAGSVDRASVGSSGGDTAHNNMQPYIALNYIIKY